MPLELPAFDKEADVPEPFKSLYEEKDGKWVGKTATEDAPVRSQGEKRLLREKKQLEEQMASITKVLGGRKPEDIQAILAAHEDEEDGKSGKPPLAKQVKELTKQLEELQATYKTVEPYKGKYEDRELEFAIREAAQKAGVFPADLKAVIRMTKGGPIRLHEKSGQPIVVDEDGDDTSLTVEKYFTESFKKEYPKFYQAAGGSGGGSTGGSPASRSDGKIVVTDNNAFSANVDKIASGQMKVVAA